MKTKLISTFLSFVFCGLAIISYSQSPKSNVSTKDKDSKNNVLLKDYGKEPFVADIESYTLSNNNFRTVLWTGSKLQLTVMSIPVGGEVGLEQHPNTDQFLRIEEGKAKVMMGDSKESLNFVKTAEDNFAIIVPAGKWHNIINIGDEPLKLYSIYAPVEHPYGTVHKTQHDAMEEEHH